MVHSQGKEERYIAEYFALGRNRQLPRQRVYVDIGAHDGTTNSNTYPLQRAGWLGVCIEPNPSTFPLLVKARADEKTGCYDVACVASDSNKQETFIEFPNLPQFSGLAPDGKKVIAEARALGKPIEPTTHVVQARTLNSILDSFFEGITTHIDFISLDVEGTEIDVLVGLDFERWQPQLLCIENNDPRNSGLTSFMQTRGYEVAQVLGINTFYERV